MRNSASPSVGSAAADAAVPSCAVMVMSCDAYRDLWTPFFTLFHRFWPDCTFPVYLGSNHAVLDHSSVRTLAAGDCSWSKVLRLGLQQIDTDYVLLLLEDFFLDRPVVTNRILHNLKTLHVLDGMVLRLFPHPGPDSTVPAHPDIGRLHPAAPYRVSAQAALWNRTWLIDFLRDDESVWDFEWKGTLRSRIHSDGFYSTYQASLLYRQVVERGQWFWGAARYYARQQIGCDFTARPVMSAAKALKKALNRFRKNSIACVMNMRVVSRV
jgi:hypothetical protein